MRKRKAPEDLSVEELRRLLIEKHRADRQERLARYRRSGRVVSLATEVDDGSLTDLRAETEEENLLEEDEYEVIPIRRGKRALDRILLVVEVLAVVGLALVLLNGLNLIRDLNQEVVSALEQPTLTPTPLIMAVVLPSGHTPPTDPGGARPNDAEIPEHLRPLVQSLANLPIPTPSPEQAIRIQIPALEIDAPIVQGDGWEQLKKGVGQNIGTGNPGQDGNMVLSAHNDIFGEIFRDLDQLQVGDEITVFTNQRAYTYIINRFQVVEPTQVSVMAPTVDPTVTLISCYPYLVDNKRYIVKAILKP